VSPEPVPSRPTKHNALIELALRCYPQWWQNRYGVEMRSLVADLTDGGRSSLHVTLDLLGGALRARTRAAGMPPVYDLWSARARFSITAATVPWMVLAPLVTIAIGGQSLHASIGRIWPPQLLLFGQSHLTLIHNHTGAAVGAPPLTGAGQTAWWADQCMNLVFFLALFVLFAGWSGLIGAIRRLDTPHRRRFLLLAWAPGLSVLADIALIVTQDIVAPHNFVGRGGRPLVPTDGHPGLAHALGLTLGIVAIAGWAISVVCVIVAARRAEIAPADLRFGKSVSVVSAALSIALFCAYATWSVGLLVQTQQAAHGGFTTIAFAHQNLWVPVLAGLFVAVAVSTHAALAARRSWRVISLGL
jgi:hypothetical protein